VVGGKDEGGKGGEGDEGEVGEEVGEEVRLEVEIRCTCYSINNKGVPPTGGDELCRGGDGESDGRLVDLSRLSDWEAAKRIAADGMHVLVSPPLIPPSMHVLACANLSLLSLLSLTPRPPSLCLRLVYFLDVRWI
jgi:hypothetical protein